MSKTKSLFDMTPEDWRLVEKWIDTAMRRPHWLQTSMLAVLRMAMETHDSVIADTKGSMKFLEDPSVTTCFQFEWDQSVSDEDSWYLPQMAFMLRTPPYESREQLVNQKVLYVEWYLRNKAIRVLTREAAYIIEGGESLQLPCERDRTEALGMSRVAEKRFVDEIFWPVPMGPFLTSFPLAAYSIDNWRELARQHPDWKTSVTLDGQLIPIDMLATVKPMFNDKDRKEAYFELELGLEDLRPELGNRGLWRSDKLVQLWQQLQDQLTERIDYLQALSLGRPPERPNPFPPAEHTMVGPTPVAISAPTSREEQAATPRDVTTFADDFVFEYQKDRKKWHLRFRYGLAPDDVLDEILDRRKGFQDIALMFGSEKKSLSCLKEMTEKDTPTKTGSLATRSEFSDVEDGGAPSVSYSRALTTTPETYRQRLRDLTDTEAEFERATREHDLENAEQLRENIKFLKAQLAKDFDKFGHARVLQATSHDHKAANTVRNRIDDAKRYVLEQVRDSEGNRKIGFTAFSQHLEHIDVHVPSCTYTPDKPLPWKVILPPPRN